VIKVFNDYLAPIFATCGYSGDEAIQSVSQKQKVADPYVWQIQKQIRKFDSYWDKHHSRETTLN